MDQPNSTNPRAEPSLDDDVESLLESVKSTQVEAPADRAEDGAEDDDADMASTPKIAKGMIASDDAGDIADILNAQHDEATHEREVNANGVEPLAGAPKINGDTAAIDAQLDVLTRQAAELAEMAEVAGAEAEAGEADAASLAGPGAPAEADAHEGVDVASLMDAVAAEVGEASGSESPHAGTLPTSVEDAAELAAQMLASANAAVEEVAGVSATDAPANAGPDANTLNDLDGASGEIADGADPAAALDDLLANLDEPAALHTPGEPVASVDTDAVESADRVEAAPAAATPAGSASAYGSASAAAAAYGSASASAAAAASDEFPVKTIQSLDDQIAQLSEDLLNQPSQADAMLPSQAPMAAIPAPAAKPLPVEPVAPAPVREAVAKDAPVHAPVATAPAHAALAPAAPAHAAAAHEAPASSEQRATPASDVEVTIAAPAKPKVSLRQRLAPVFTQVSALLGASVGVATPLLAVLSAPLAKKPRIVRDSIGWIAVNTVFCASCLWGYMLFLRPDQVAEQHVAFDLAHSELPEVPAHAGGHDAHGDAAEGGHEAPKDDGPGAKKDDGHGAKKDDGHGGAAKSGAKKEAYKPPSRKPPTKADRAKAKPKDEGKGGGGGH
jgi:hypothetical protein